MAIYSLDWLSVDMTLPYCLTDGNSLRLVVCIFLITLTLLIKGGKYQTAVVSLYTTTTIPQSVKFTQLTIQPTLYDSKMRVG